MACYAGTSTQPDDRKKQHKKNYPNMTNWRVVKKVFSKTAAGEWEKEQTECEHHGPGFGPEKATWHCYKFTK